MVGWTLLEAMLGGDAEKLLGDADFDPPVEDEDEPEGDAVLPDCAEKSGG